MRLASDAPCSTDVAQGSWHPAAQGAAQLPLQCHLDRTRRHQRQQGAAPGRQLRDTCPPGIPSVAWLSLGSLAAAIVYQMVCTLAATA
mmetsp:Transcript_30364/g.77472  ORF Transcript_30364/g.77472 Transcript_30364/m.77472 type:complete len:88 (-) Transcript_30364:1586-1849(-)